MFLYNNNFFASYNINMKAYVIFNILIQLIILFSSVNLYFDTLDIRLLFSMILVSIIFVPSITEFSLEIKFKSIIHYIITTICLFLFLILIAI